MSKRAFELLASLNQLLKIPEYQKTEVTEASVDDEDQLYKDVVSSILDQFDSIDKIQDSFDRRTRKTALLLQLKPSNVTRNLKEIH